MKNLIPMLIIYILPLSIFAQQDKPETLLDAGRLVVDLIQLFKSDKNAEPATTIALSPTNDCVNNTNKSTCFTNNSRESISVLLFNNHSSTDTLDLLINDRGSECAYQLRAGVYTYIVLNPPNQQIIRKGQIMLTPCVDQEFDLASR